MEPVLSVKELSITEVPLLVDYWHQPDKAFLQSMGVDLQKVPARNDLTQMLEQQAKLPYEQKASYCMIWLLDGEPVGHCNVNKIVLGQEAYMHLHAWQKQNRRKGYGVSFIKLCVPWFFKNLNLQVLYSEPYALNPAPHRALEKAGFERIKNYTCIPGSVNFEQEVVLWRMEAGLR
jgi:[ribosomal protein S5]-alanine N-acetyltransferase